MLTNISESEKDSFEVIYHIDGKIHCIKYITLIERFIVLNMSWGKKDFTSGNISIKEKD